MKPEWYRSSSENMVLDTLAYLQQECNECFVACFMITVHSQGHLPLRYSQQSCSGHVLMSFKQVQSGCHAGFHKPSIAWPVPFHCHHGGLSQLGPSSCDLTKHNQPFKGLWRLKGHIITLHGYIHLVYVHSASYGLH